VNVKIVQRGGNETVIAQETYRKVSGQLVDRFVIPSSVSDPGLQTYRVEWNATNSPEVGGSAVIGQTQLPLDIPGVGDEILSVVGIFLIFIVAGLFYAANVSVGAIVTALVAGGLWFIGVIPSPVSAIFVLVALMLGVLIHVRRGPEYRG